ncbi:MAG: asparagine synthase-related protein [Legionellales bacterium]|nr:asparagine synthase-related protein [Legionellales bacterium]
MVRKLYGCESFNPLTHPNNQSQTLYYHGTLPADFISFQQTLDKQTWLNHFHPFSCVYFCQLSCDIILVRDHLGVEPLFYYAVGETFIIGQTIPEILNHLPSMPQLCGKKLQGLFSEQELYTDETLYRDICRVEPGSIMHFKGNGSVHKYFYWRLEPEGPVLRYSNPQDYLAHFSMLMKEATKNAIDHFDDIACEYSGGLDSSAIYSTLRALNCDATLYQHQAIPGSYYANTYNNKYENAFIAHHQPTNILRINADNFDPIAVFEMQAKWFCGPSPFIFTMFAHPLLAAVNQGKHPVLLSGFGGDQCVSGDAPANFYVYELLRHHHFRQAWYELSNSKKNAIQRGCHLIKFLHPKLYENHAFCKIMFWKMHNLFRAKQQQLPFPFHPATRRCYKSLREAEWSVLQGPDSFEIRLRIEYSSIVAKKMGFEYRYPLLYPKLLEFMLSLPPEQKRHAHESRYLIKRYLARLLRAPIFDTYQKKEGLAIIPGSMDIFKQRYQNGMYEEAFRELPAHLMQASDPMKTMRNLIRGYMIKVALCNGASELNDKD